ncbi:hypothetical protein MKY53_05485 [Macrococcus sp. FSL R5-0951]|uniref:hypothetical protein n=1 Tax=Macrococcoides caseolyticum TaxID=69966 RepID=UPI0024BC9B99|nr:hypothetical protein [Macrococcus caseolyticus]MDJ1153024.1 hypothetical protein [Macrococcus caseolyticus]
MVEKYHIELISTELELFNFIKKKSKDDYFENPEPQYKILLNKEVSNVRSGLILVELENDYYELKVGYKGNFKSLLTQDIKNDELSKLIIPLLLPFVRVLIHNNLREAGFELMLPTIDVKRSISSDD